MTPALSASRRNIVLIGPRGAGKTSVGRLLATRLGWNFVDTDDLVTGKAGLSIREIFEQQGEPAFRALEAHAIAAAAAGSSHVISVGGGGVLRPENRARLSAAGLVVWLTADVDELQRRIAGDPQTAGSRPALTPYAARDELEHLLAIRRPLYAEIASVTIDTTGLAADAVVDMIAAQVHTGPDRGSAA